MVTHHYTQVQGMATQVSHASWSAHNVGCQTKTRYENLSKNMCIVWYRVVKFR